MYGPVCTVVWEGEGCETFPYPNYGYYRTASRGRGKKENDDGPIPDRVESDRSSKHYGTNGTMLIEKICEADPVTCAAEFP